jgi:Holliday junction resolvase
MNNKKRGSDFEKVVCRALANEGYWVHFITPDARGAQPFDIIAVKHGVAMAVECKTLSDKQNYFPMSRLEDNQIMAFEKWTKCGNALIFVAVEWRGKIYMIPYSDLKKLGKIDMRLEENA